MSFAYAKAKSAAKVVTPKGKSLDALVQRTMGVIGDMVGATLGPGGRPVVIERQESNLPSIVTKDGVTVMRNLGFADSTQHCILEVARDAAIRTANEAGDGTTTATVLARTAVKSIGEYCERNRKVSPQRVVRRLEKLFRDVIEPTIKQNTISVSLADDRDLLLAVARVSGNGDSDLANAVMECFDVVGDDGNVTIAEVSGPSGYQVERIDGFPIATGYEESCIAYASNFINEPANQRLYLHKPIFLLYNGDIKQIQLLMGLMQQIGTEWSEGRFNNPNIIVVATGFSETVIGSLALNFLRPDTVNVYPMTAPRTAIPNSQLNFLQDLAALTGAKVLDAINAPLERATMDDLSPPAPNDKDGIQSFEAYRYRSTLVGFSDEDQVLDRVSILQAQRKNAASQLDGLWLDERIGKLTGGIARLNVVGASNGELKEKRDRAEDAVCAVRGAIKFGCLPGGGWMLLKLIDRLRQMDLGDDDIALQVLIPTLRGPVDLLLENAGFHADEIEGLLAPVVASIDAGDVKARAQVYDVLGGQYVNAVEGGILDAAPAVLEAVRNSISIASLLGTLGGTVVFARDNEIDKQEARDTANFLRDGESYQRDV